MLKKIITTLLILSVSWAAQADEVNVKKLSKRDWIMLESKNFLVFSDAKEKTAIAMLEELEHFNYFMAILMGYEPVELDRKIPFVLARNASTYRAMGIQEEYAGLFSPAGGGHVYARADKFRASNAGGGSWGRSVVLHELTHFLMNSSSLGLANPPWFNEGIAEYFGTFIQKRDQIVLGDMRILRNRFYSLLINNLSGFKNVDSESLFKTPQSKLGVGQDQTNKQREFVDTFYARSVAVVHYLNADPERRKKMYQFLYAINKGYTVDDSFQAIFNMSYEAFDQQVMDYLDGRYVMARTFPLGEGGVEFPAVVHKRIEINKMDAMHFLYAKLSLLANGMLKSNDVEKMNTDFEKLYPGFFTN